MSTITNIQNDFGQYLFNFIKSKVDSHEDAEDIYQDVLVKIIKKSNQLKDQQSLKSWVFTIANNQVIDYYRTRKLAVDIDKLPKSKLYVQEEEEVYEELEGCLNGFIDQLPNDYKEVITLSELKGYSQKELARILDMNYVTLRSKVQRGRNKIKDMIMEACAIDQDSAGRFVDCNPKPDTSCNSSNSSCN